MSFCVDAALVKYDEQERCAKPLACRCWSCERCGPERRKQLMAMAASGAPERFLTLTVNPHLGESPANRLAGLIHAFQVILKRLRRRHGVENVQYLAVVEATKAGEPHLHVLLRSPYLVQSELSAWMDELTSAPVVDIRRVKGARQVVQYIAKYISKAPAQFGTFKRYWSSRGWELDRSHKPDKSDPFRARWQLDRRPLREILAEWTRAGWVQRFDGRPDFYTFQVRIELRL